ncbi:MAG: cytochrome P450 [Acidobacteriota bacterium]|nr:cytochrome P450 [Acidobacteriota bacterium]
MRDIPTGPRAIIGLRFLRAMQNDPVSFLTRVARAYGDIVQFRIGGHVLVLLNHPDLIHEMVVARHRSFRKNHVLQRVKAVLGEGLFTSDGDLHRVQRRLSQPAFHRERIAAYAEVMVARATAMRGAWQDGATIDIHREMTKVTLSVVAKTLFDADLQAEADEIGGAITDLIDLFPRVMNPVALAMLRLPIPARFRLRAAMRRLDRTIYTIIENRRASGDDRGDLLSMLLFAHDEEGGGMTDMQLRDETLTLLLAGHETTASALAWTWYLLALHPAVAHEVHRVVDQVLGDRPATASDYPHLRYLEMVVAEAMRLYPPAWIVSGDAVEEVNLGGWRVPPQALVLASQAVTHRDPRWWDEPDTFDPLRFTAEASASRPKFAYFPFSSGPRVCIAEGFAWMESVLMLATFAQHWSMEAVSRNVKTQASLTLRPRGGIRVRLSKRVRTHMDAPLHAAGAPS